MNRPTVTALSRRWMGEPEKRAALILAAITAFEGLWVAINFGMNPTGFARFLGLARGRLGHPAGWLLAVIVAGAFVVLSLRLRSVRDTVFHASRLKGLAILLAVVSGILEEAVFRKLLMDWLAARGATNVGQVAASGVAFGVAHAVWGLMGRSFRAALGATIATGTLGLALAIVYLLAGRSVAPCIAAHFVINALAEPGLALAACRGEMGASSPARKSEPGA